MQTVDSGKGKIVEAFGLQTNYLEMGEGEPLLLLHGSGPGVSASTNWGKVMPELAKHFRVIAPDLAGFGYTERKPDFSYDIKHWGKHLLAFLDALGIEKRKVMSHFPFAAETITDELVEERYQASLIPGAQEGLRKLLVKPNEEGDTPLSGMPEHVVATIKHPAIVLHGREDKVVPTEMGFKLGRSMPNADLHVLANCGHWVMAERPEAFLQLVINHFSAS